MSVKIRRSMCLIIMTALLLSGCLSYPADKEYYNELSDYPNIWELAGFYLGSDEQSPLFPEDISALDVADYFCRYDQLLPLGEGVQLLLHIRYDEIAFSAETQRIEALTTDRTDAFHCTKLRAQVLYLGTDYMSEYALIDDEDHSIYYIYLSSIPKNQLEIDLDLIPTGYTGYGEIDEKDAATVM